jgi:hypothetical protein
MAQNAEVMPRKLNDVTATTKAVMAPETQRAHE